jgi:uncharacterized protein (TIGR02246 family)
MTKIILLLLLAPCLAIAGPDQDIRRVMDDQVAAWNRGDVDAFARGYLDSPDLLFVGKVMTRGYAPMVQHYKQKYPTAQAMGRLRFSDLEVHLLGAQYANVIGRFHLDRVQAAGGNADGVFTLIFQKTAQGWKIIQDHTS